MSTRSPLTQSTNLNGPVPIGSVASCSTDFGRDDDRVAPGHVEGEIAVGRLERDLDGGRVDHLDAVDPGEQRLLGIGRIGCAGAVEAELDVRGRHRRAVMECHPALEVEGPDLAALGHLPAFRQRRQDRAVGAEAGKAFEDVGIGHLVDRRGGAGGRVEVRRLQHHADGDRVLRGEGRRGAERQRGGGQSQTVEHQTSLPVDRRPGGRAMIHGFDPRIKREGGRP